MKDQLEPSKRKKIEYLLLYKNKYKNRKEKLDTYYIENKNKKNKLNKLNIYLYKYFILYCNYKKNDT